MKKITVVVFVLVALLIGGFIRSMAQSMPVVLISAPSGSTLTNCGSPTVPSFCVVGTGVYAWQNAVQGWFLVAAASATGVQKVNGVAPGSTGNVTVSCASAAPSITVTGTTVGSGTTLTQLSNPGVVAGVPATTCSAVGN
jgi:hypothetical protein